jgi:hypothetical protein
MGDYTFVNRAEKSVIDCDLESEDIGNKVVSSHMPLLIMLVIGNMRERESTTEPTVENETHKFIMQAMKIQNHNLLIL